MSVCKPAGLGVESSRPPVSPSVPRYHHPHPPNVLYIQFPILTVLDAGPVDVVVRQWNNFRTLSRSGVTDEIALNGAWWQVKERQGEGERD